LALDIDSCDTRQVDDGQVWTVVRVNSEFDWVVDDVTAFSGNFISELFDVCSDVVEIVVFFV
jgi:hypothetical protein